jgi:Phospholipid-translocating P-type ATPase C-terminal
MIYTAMPVLALGTFDKDVEERMSLKFSKLYTPGQRNLFFTREKFAQSAIHGILTSLVLFGVTLGNEERVTRVTLSLFSSHLSSPFFVQQFFILF